MAHPQHQALPAAWQTLFWGRGGAAGLLWGADGAALQVSVQHLICWYSQKSHRHCLQCVKWRWSTVGLWSAVGDWWAAIQVSTLQHVYSHNLAEVLLAVWRCPLYKVCQAGSKSSAGALLGAAWAAFWCRHSSITTWAALTRRRRCQGHLWCQGRGDRQSAMESSPGSVSGKHKGKYLWCRFSPHTHCMLRFAAGQGVCSAVGTCLGCIASPDTTDRSAGTAQLQSQEILLLQTWPGSLCSTKYSTSGGTPLMPCLLPGHARGYCVCWACGSSVLPHAAAAHHHCRI